MMIMEGSNMSKKEYDFKAIMYSAYDKPHKLRNILAIKLSGYSDYHPIVQADPCVSSNAPSLGSSGGLGHPLLDLFFREGGASVSGA